MSELRKEELLRELKEMKEFVRAWEVLNPKKVSWSGIKEQAYQQIREIVKLHFSDDWQTVKKELGKFMQKQKPEVSQCRYC